MPNKKKLVKAAKKVIGKAIKRNVKASSRKKHPYPALKRPKTKFSLGGSIKIGNDFKKKRQLKKIKEWESKK